MAEFPIQFLFGDRELIVTVSDLLQARVDVIVNSADCELTHGNALSQQILQAAGEEMDQQCRQLILEYGQIDNGMAVYTSSGKLGYKAIIHAVGPGMSGGDEQRIMEQAISRSLQLCEINQWRSIAFPVVTAGHDAVPVSVCGKAFFRSITHFWDARHECEVQKIELCLPLSHADEFYRSFRDDAFDDENINQHAQSREPADSRDIAIVDLSDQDLDDLKKTDEDDWFT